LLLPLHIGAFPKKLKVFKEQRLKQKKLGNDSKQLSLKILINGGCGVFGASDYSYYDPRVAELITAYGRTTLFKMQDNASTLNFEIVYGDTDSLFLSNPPSRESLSKFQDECIKKLDIQVEIKSTYHTFILSSVKKHYIGYDKNKDAIDIIGMEGKKSDRAEFYHNVFKQVVNDVVKCNANPIHNLRYPDERTYNFR
jgi:DNA polymerase I